MIAPRIEHRCLYCERFSSFDGGYEGVSIKCPFCGYPATLCPWDLGIGLSEEERRRYAKSLLALPPPTTHVPPTPTTKGVRLKVQEVNVTVGSRKPDSDGSDMRVAFALMGLGSGVGYGLIQLLSKLFGG